MKRFHTASECFLATGPMFFHSFWSLVRISAVSFQSVLSFRASAFSQNAFFLFQVGCHCFLHRFEESSFPAEEFIAGSAETFENLDVHLLWSIADGFPFGLKGKDFIGLVFPVGKSSEGVIFHTFHDFANHRLLVQVILFFFFQFFKMLLMTFVDNRRGSLETAPDFFAQFFGYRTDGTEFLMKLLRLVESRNYVGLFSQFFCELRTSESSVPGFS